MDSTRTRVIEVVLGLALSFVLVLSVVLIWDSFSGSFSNKVTVSAQLSQAGDALEQGDIVTYRDVIVGEVTSAAGKLNGGAVATLKLDPRSAAVIPASVSAVAVPQSLFGLTLIELVAPADPSGPTLRTGDVIEADRTPAAESLQTALANAYQLLTAVHPAQLDSALSSLAAALQGKGEDLGRLVSEADAYLRQLAPDLPELDQTIRSLATVTDEVAKNAPDLVSSLANLLVTSKAILADKQAIASVLAVGPAAVASAQALLNPTNVNHAVTVFRNELPVAQALAANPNALAQTIDGFRQFATTFGQTMTSGPYVKTDIVLTGANFAELFNAIIGGQGHVFDSVSDPPEYTAADCPRYAGADGPNCGAAAGPAGASARVLTTGTNYGGTSSSVGSKQELFAVRAAASAITGLPAAQIPDMVDLLLGPLLRGIPTVLLR